MVNELNNKINELKELKIKHDEEIKQKKNDIIINLEIIENLQKEINEKKNKINELTKENEEKNKLNLELKRENDIIKNDIF